MTFKGKANGSVVAWAYRLSEDNIALLSQGAVLYVTVGRTRYQFQLVGHLSTA